METSAEYFFSFKGTWLNHLIGTPNDLQAG
ncbi:MAG: hypothetical protein ACI8T1_004861 [Verrucomicrobiales bacterium]|jgi:hypothetical protein